MSETFIHVRRSRATKRVGGRRVCRLFILVRESGLIVRLARYFCLRVGPEGAFRGGGARWDGLGGEFFGIVGWRGLDAGFVLWSVDVLAEIVQGSDWSVRSKSLQRVAVGADKAVLLQNSHGRTYTVSSERLISRLA